MRGQVLVIFTASLVFIEETQLVSIDNVLFGGFSVKLPGQILNLFSKKGTCLSSSSLVALSVSIKAEVSLSVMVVVPP